MFGLEWKSREMEKMKLNKFTHISLLNNDAKFKKKKKKVTNNHTKEKKKKKQSPKIFYKNKKHVPKKSHLVKIKINYHAQALKNQKKKKKEKRKKKKK